MPAGAAEQQFGARHRVDVRGQRHRQAERLGEHGPDRGVRPAQPGVVEVPGGAVDDAARGDADPQRPAPVPAAQVAAGAAGERGERRVLRTARRRRLDDVEGAAEQVGRHDAGGAGADVDAEGQERLVVDLDRHPRAADGAGDGQVGALPQHPGVEQGGDLAVHRGDAQAGGLGDDVAGDRAAQPGGAEHRRGGRLGDAQRGGDDVVAGEQRALGVGGRRWRLGGLVRMAVVVLTGCPSSKSAGGVWATPGDSAGRNVRVQSGAAKSATTTTRTPNGDAGSLTSGHVKNLARQLKLVE